MARKPVQIVVAGLTRPGTLVHAEVASNRLACYRPFLVTIPVEPADMVEHGLMACSYCWPDGITWKDIP